LLIDGVVVARLSDESGCIERLINKETPWIFSSRLSWMRWQQNGSADKHTAYPPAFAALQEEKALPASTQLRQNKFLNNVIEQDHRFLQRLIPGLGFKSFNTARRTIKGYEAMHMLRKGQVMGVSRGDVLAQLNFMAQIFEVAA